MRALTRCALIDPYVNVLSQVRHVGRVRTDALEVTGERRLVGKDLLCKPLVQLALHRLVTLRPGRRGAKASDDYSGGVQDSRGAIVYIGLGAQGRPLQCPLMLRRKKLEPESLPGPPDAIVEAQELES